MRFRESERAGDSQGKSISMLTILAAMQHLLQNILKILKEAMVTLSNLVV